MKHPRILAAIVGVVMLVAGLAIASPASAATSTMSQHQAGRYYLTQICRENHAIDLLNESLPPMHHGRWDAEDMHGKVVVRVRDALRIEARAFYTSGRNLFNPPARWPSSVDAPVNRIANLSVTHAVADRHLANDGKEGIPFTNE